MPIIGTFSAVKDGYAGTIRTLILNIKMQFVANDRREADGAPDFRIVAGAAEIGAAWRRRSVCSPSPASSSPDPPAD